MRHQIRNRVSCRLSLVNDAYLHKSIDNRRSKRHSPRPLICLYRTYLGVGPWLISNQLRNVP
ncbi:hypothetical protein C1N58_14565 [Pantoea sp. SGAir0180]